VIGKAGETIKSFKKQSGASIEIDQNLPEDMPRAVIFRGTRKQVAAAKKLVDGMVQRATEDEKKKAADKAPIGAAGSAAKSVDPATEKDLPPWRRGEASTKETEPRPTAGLQVSEQRPRAGQNRRDMQPWTTKRQEAEAAPSGSLTGALTSLSGMRPAWMKPKGFDGHDDAPMLGVEARSIWINHQYSRSLMLQAKQKILRGKAYEVPEEMMTMSVGARPKFKVEKKEKDVDDGAGQEKEATPPAQAEAAAVASAPPPAAGGGPGEGAVPDEKEKKQKKEKKEAKVAEGAGGPYENLAGDSKDIMKLKKKLREIQKIEDAITGGEVVEPNQVDKVSKKAGYLEELEVLQAIARSAPPLEG